MPTARSEITGAVLNDKIYIIGGFDKNGKSTSNVEVYDPVTGKWTQSTSLPQPLDHAAAASFNGKLYVVFDYSGKKMLAIVDEALLESLRAEYIGDINNPDEYLWITFGILALIVLWIIYWIQQRTRLQCLY